VGPQRGPSRRQDENALVSPVQKGEFVRVLGSSSRRVAAVVIACLAWSLANVTWLVHNREGQPLNIDEAGYLGIALNNAFGWERGGASGWVDSVLWPSQHAPLTTALTSLGLLTGWDPIAVALGVVLTFAFLTLLLTAALATVTRDRAVVVLSLALVATAPGFIELSRSYVFAVPAAAVTLAALYALVRSRGLTSMAWSVVFGASLGLMPLARAMTIAFVPVILVAAAVHSAAHDGSWRRKFTNLGIASVLAVAVASVWLVPSAHLVFGYLTEYGYGNQSVEYATHAPSPPLALLTTLGDEYYAPYLVLLAAGWCAAAWGAVTWLREGPARIRIRALLASPMFPLAAFVLGACLALMTSKNAGSGFTIPLLAPAALVAAVGWVRAIRLLRHSRMRQVTLVALCLGCAILAYPSFDSQSMLAEHRAVNVLGTSLTVTNGRGLDPAYPFPVSNRRAWSGAWATAFEKLTSDVLDGPTTRPDMAFGFRGNFANVNVIELSVIERLHHAIPVAQIDPVAIGPSMNAYASWLTTDDAGASCHLMTSAGSVNEFKPLVDNDALEAAAMTVGFKAVDKVPTPDGRSVTVWKRSGNGC
jgi:hypothetical protein